MAVARTSEPPRRSDATRAAILAAAREQFAARGYQAATIRAIAAAPGCVYNLRSSEHNLSARRESAMTPSSNQ